MRSTILQIVFKFIYLQHEVLYMSFCFYIWGGKQTNIKREKNKQKYRCHKNTLIEYN